jgi:hypothetical protein
LPSASEGNAKEDVKRPSASVLWCLLVALILSKLFQALEDAQQELCNSKSSSKCPDTNNCSPVPKAEFWGTSRSLAIEPSAIACPGTVLLHASRVNPARRRSLGISTSPHCEGARVCHKHWKPYSTSKLINYLTASCARLHRAITLWSGTYSKSSGLSHKSHTMQYVRGPTNVADMDDWDHLLASSESLVHGVGFSSEAIDGKTAACLDSIGSLLL